MKIYIIYNPAAGSAHRFNRLSRLEKRLRELNNEVVTLPTHRPGDGKHNTRQALAEGAEVVVAVGGDGTLNEVIQVLAGTPVPLVAYPAGTTNVWCKQIRMPLNPRKAASVILNGTKQTVDLGKLGDRYFLVMAGIGFDGEIVRAINTDVKKRIGKLAYIFAAIPLIKIKQFNFSIKFNPGSADEHNLNFSSAMLVVQNAQRYATVNLAPTAKVCDGKMELVVFNTSNMWEKLARVLSVASGNAGKDKKIERFSLRKAVIRSETPVAAQVDGDLYGIIDSQPLEITCEPGALNVLVPVTAPGYIFNNSR